LTARKVCQARPNEASDEPEICPVLWMTLGVQSHSYSFLDYSKLMLCTWYLLGHTYDLLNMNKWIYQFHWYENSEYLEVIEVQIN